MSSWYRRYVSLIENSLVPFVPEKQDAIEGEMSSPHRENLSIRDAKMVLDSYPEGYLSHDIFETDAFVAVTKYGIYVFYNPVTDRLMHWDWIKDVAELKSDEAYDDYDIMTDWAYTPAHEMEVTVGGMEWWDRIRSGLEVPDDTPPAQLKENELDEHAMAMLAPDEEDAIFKGYWRDVEWKSGFHNRPGIYLVGPETNTAYGNFQGGFSSVEAADAYREKHCPTFRVRINRPD